MPAYATAEPMETRKPANVSCMPAVSFGHAIRIVPSDASPIAVHFCHVNGSRQMMRATTVTMIGALHWMIVAIDGPLISTAKIHATWNVATARMPIAANHGRSCRPTRSCPRCRTARYPSRQSDVISIRQNARLSGLNPPSCTSEVMNRPAVDQHTVARMTRPRPPQRTAPAFAACSPAARLERASADGSVIVGVPGAVPQVLAPLIR